MSRDSRITFSEEFLNAFVDNQLTAEEKAQAYLEIGQDQNLNRQVCELRKMHDLVQLAYQDIPPAPAARQTPRRRRGFGVAATMLLALGVALGMQINVQRAPVHTAGTDHTATSVPAGNRPTTSAAPQAMHVALLTSATDTKLSEPVLMDFAIPPRTPLPAHGVINKVLIHLTDDKSSQVGAALDEIEALMRHYRESQQTAHVEVVMNGRGLDLVRTDTTIHATRIAKLQREYHNLTFAACQNTIERLQREQNIAIRLLPGVIIIDSGMAEIMRRQNQGWTYLQV